MYSFLNSQSCICTVGDLERLRDLGHEAVEHLRVALIGAPAGSNPMDFNPKPTVSTSREETRRLPAMWGLAPGHGVVVRLPLPGSEPCCAWNACATGTALCATVCAW